MLCLERTYTYLSTGYVGVVLLFFSFSFFFAAEFEKVRGHVRGVAFCIYTMCERVTINWQGKLMRSGATS